MTTTVAPPVNQQFIGYYVSGTSASEQDCGGGSTFTVFGNYGDCCATTSATVSGGCTWRTSCIDQTRIQYGPSDTRVCIGTDAVCQTQRIFNDYPTKSGATPVTKVICAATPYNALTVYRTVNLGATSTSSSSTTSTSATATATSTDSAAPQASSSKAWIAGAVIGPLALLIIIGLLAYIIVLKRKRHQHNTPPEVHEPAPEYKPEYMPASHHGSYSGSPGIMAGAPFAQPPHRPMSELSGEPATPLELPGDHPYNPNAHYSPGPVVYGQPQAPH